VLLLVSGSGAVVVARVDDYGGADEAESGFE